jgi:hypothetical protein
MKHGIYSLLIGGFLFAAMPASSSYSLHNYGFGSGGTSTSTSSSYKLNAISGETSNVQSSSATYKARSGNNNSQQANVPNAPTFTNPSSYYDKLNFVVNPGGTSATDTKYAVAISSDNFLTTKFVQADDTVNNTKVYQTYAAWGSATGQNVIGLSASTTYKMKVSAMQGNFTETEFGPIATAATVAQSISFTISTDSQPSPPFSTAFGNLLPATVTTASDKVAVALTTNANAGATVYISSLNAGLKSPHAGNFTISSATADLSAAATGYGAQNFSVGQTTGGPMSSIAPYNVAAQNVGLLSTILKPIYTSTAPITGGTGSFKLMAKAATSTPAAKDYADTLNLTAAGSF